MANTCFNLLQIDNPSDEFRSFMLDICNKSNAASLHFKGIVIDGVADRALFDLACSDDSHLSVFNYTTKWTTSFDFAKVLATKFPNHNFSIEFEEFGCQYAGKILGGEGSVSLYYVEDDFWVKVDRADNDDDEIPSIDEHLAVKPETVFELKSK